jgi:glycine dehydrogenase subunit 1
MPYTPHTQKDIDEMLKVIGASSVEELFKSIPKKHKLKSDDLNIKAGLSEYHAKNVLENLANKNKTYLLKNSFMGAGVYYHYIPSAVNHIAGRSEFYTAYTPYQPEVSQGTLQVIFEFQSMICSLTGMDVSNASMYDGATALAEAVLVAYRAKRGKFKKLLYPKTLHPEYLEVLKNYLLPFGIELVEVSCNEKTALIDINDLKAKTEGAFSAILQNPNFYGVVEEEANNFTNVLKQSGVFSIFLSIEPTSLAMYEAPGNLGFDIAVLEIQSFGNPVSFGGPHAGVIVSKKEFMRNLPGRIVGKTKDVEGKKAFVLTLATREQHIRREKATSNICSNQALVALRSTAYLALTGGKGLMDLAKLNYTLSHYFLDSIKDLNLLVYDADSYNEFVLDFKDKAKRDKVVLALKENNILPGYLLGNTKLIVAVTELNLKSTIDNYLKILRREVV